MVRWLAIGAAVSLAYTNPAGAQLKGLTVRAATGGVHVKAPDFRMRAAPLSTRRHSSGGMLVSQDLAPNAVLGLKLGGSSSRKQGNMDFRVGGTPGRGHKPTLTFLLHF